MVIHPARQLPSIAKILRSAEVEALCGRYGRAPTVATLRGVLSALRARLEAGEPIDGAAGVPALALHLRAALEARALAPVINATGVVLHTNLGRAPLAPAAIAAVGAVARGYSNLEFDLQAGERGSRTAHIEPLLRRLTGAEASLVANNGAAAVLLALTALARGGDVLVSRGELVEIGGGFRIPEVIAQSGARLVEVGATNRTRLADYERALGPQTRVILKTHPSNYRILGFTESVPREPLAALAHAHGLAFVEDLGSGALIDMARFGLPAEPTVQDCIRDGADVVCFSGDKLLGGPQAGIALGRERWIEPLRCHPLMRALRSDKLTLAALGATLALYEDPSTVQGEVPVLRMLGTPLDQVRRRARRARRALAGVPGLTCEVSEEDSVPGGGTLPLATLPTAVLRLRAQSMSCQSLASACLAQRPAVVGRLRGDALLLDLRTVEDSDVRPMAASVRRALA
jgi:L-seryl-tRNA(Ser) seleniumtransferase